MKKQKNKKLMSWFVLGIAIVILLFGLFISRSFANHSLAAPTGLVVGDNIFTNIMIPSTVASIVFSLLALATILFLVYRMKSAGVGGTFPFKSYIASVVMVFVIYALNYFVTFFPYGNLTFLIVIFILQVMVYGILLPFILLAHLCYIILLFRGQVKDIFK